MDTTESIREIVKNVVRQYAALRPSHGEIRLDLVFDEAHDRYALLQVGWDRGRRVRGLLLYIVVADDKIYIEYDGMEQGIREDLLDRGVAEDDIVFPYLSEAVA